MRVLTQKNPMKMRILAKDLVGHFSLNLPAQGIVGTGTTFEMLYNNCVKWRKANAMPVGLGFEDELEQAVCQKYPTACHIDTTDLPQPKGTLSAGDVLRGSKVMIAHWVKGSPLVTQEEANARAAVCSKCPWRTEVRYSCGAPCGELVSFAAGVGAKQTDPALGDWSCGICHCFLKAAVWLPLDTQCVGVDAHLRAEFKQVRTQVPCWKKCGN
jgi:hypothetical protein